MTLEKLSYFDIVRHEFQYIVFASTLLIPSSYPDPFSNLAVNATLMFSNIAGPIIISIPSLADKPFLPVGLAGNCVFFSMKEQYALGLRQAKIQNATGERGWRRPGKVRKGELNLY